MADALLSFQNLRTLALPYSHLTAGTIARYFGHFALLRNLERLDVSFNPVVARKYRHASQEALVALNPGFAKLDQGGRFVRLLSLNVISDNFDVLPAWLVERALRSERNGYSGVLLAHDEAMMRGLSASGVPPDLQAAVCTAKKFAGGEDCALASWLKPITKELELEAAVSVAKLVVEAMLTGDDTMLRSRFGAMAPAMDPLSPLMAPPTGSAASASSSSSAAGVSPHGTMTPAAAQAAAATTTDPCHPCFAVPDTTVEAGMADAALPWPKSIPCLDHYPLARLVATLPRLRVLDLASTSIDGDQGLALVAGIARRGTVTHLRLADSLACSDDALPMALGSGVAASLRSVVLGTRGDAEFAKTLAKCKGGFSVVEAPPALRMDAEPWVSTVRL